ncbi:uncharacterized protein LOC131855356 [Achroia grisella]|uniref:uncharacterized protein LOC131855356 n=1 Tax=Achroia grisella TaxID=688607 RepID=UPI0027D2C93C|nr:uncharacterized protein LOC131855356 [Achroia grisella]
MFFEKPVLNTEKWFTADDLLQYVQSIVRYSRLHERRHPDRSNYRWLSSKTVSDSSIDKELDQFKTLVKKLSSESCTAVAIKLQSYTDEDTSSTAILTSFEHLLEEQYNIQLMENNVKRVKETTLIGKRKLNRVRPELLPPGRQPTVSFIID